MAYDPGNNPFQSDNRFNSFENPWNGVNANQGNGQWGMNSNYMTPSYMSPYRPQYQGNGNPNQGHNPGFWSSANYLVNPFRGGGDNYGGQVYGQTNPFYNSVANKPVDWAANAAQQFIVPAALTHWAYKSFISNSMGNIGKSMGRGLGVGLGSGLGMQGRTAATMAVNLGKVGAFGMKMFGGMALAGAAMGGVVDPLVFDPYISQRMMSNDLRDNFSGITFGGNYGNSITGKGFSRGQAAEVARGLNVAGARDLTFSQKEYGGLAGMLSRTGILDNVDGAQIGGQLQNLIKQAKTVMSVLNTSDFREVSTAMAKLARSGSSLGDISKNLLRMGSYASAAGISTSQFMNTTGLQGQFMAQSMGMTPLAGMMVAGQAHAAFGSAFRSGLISNEVMARMGGVEGATQSATSGLLKGLNSPYLNMMGMNNLFGKGNTNSLVGDIAGFGGMVSKDPIGMSGLSEMLGPGIASNYAKSGNGLLKIQEAILKQANTSPKAYGLGADGRIQSQHAYKILTSTYGLSRDEAMGIINQFGAASDPGSYAAQQKAYRSSLESSKLDLMRQYGKDYGGLTEPISWVKNIGRELVKNASDNSGLQVIGEAGDQLQSWMFGVKHGSKKNDISAEDVLKGLSTKSASILVAPNKAKVGDLDTWMDSKHAAKKINEASLSGNKLAAAFFNAKNYSDRENAVLRLAENGVIGSQYKDRENISTFLWNMSQYTVKTSSESPDKNFSRILDKELFASTGKIEKKGISNIERLELSITAKEISDLERDGKKGTPEHTAAVTKLKGLVNPKYKPNLDNDIDRETFLQYTATTADLGIGGLMAAYKNPGELARIKKELSGKSPAEQNKILIQDASKRGYSLSVDRVHRNGTSYMSSAESYGGIDLVQNQQDLSANLLKLAREGKIDTSTYYSAEAALTMDRAADKMNTAANTLLAASGNKQDTPGPSLNGYNAGANAVKNPKP